MGPKDTLLVFLPMVLLYSLRTIDAERQNVCHGYPFKVKCQSGHVLVMEGALFGRMEVGRCVTSEIGHMGCTNDVLFLMDRWCSGQSSCEVDINDANNKDLNDANTECNKNLKMYLQATYTCIKVRTVKHSRCKTRKSLTVGHHNQGMFSSHVTDETNCGSVTAPWQIKAAPGQTIDISLLDFNALDRGRRTTPKCSDVYGYVTEDALKINDTICGQTERESVVYSSKSNSLEIALKRNSGFRFLLSYKLKGCTDIHPPQNAWYKRTKDKIKMGCENTGAEWELVCKNSRWEGPSGNCTQMAVAAAMEQSEEPFEHFGVIVLTGLLGGTIVLAVSIVVFGLMYIHKYRDRKEKVLVSLLNKKKQEKEKEKEANGQNSPPNKAPRASFRPLSTATNFSEGYLQPTTSGGGNRISMASEGYLQPTGRAHHVRTPSVMSSTYDGDSILLGVYETPPGSERQSRNSAFLNRFSLREIALRKNPTYDNSASIRGHSRCGSSVSGIGLGPTEMIAVFEEPKLPPPPPSEYSSAYAASPCSTGAGRITIKPVTIHTMSLDKRRCPSPPPEEVPSDTDTLTEMTALTSAESDNKRNYDSQCDASGTLTTSLTN